MTPAKLKFSEILLLALVNWKNFKGKVDRRALSAYSKFSSTSPLIYQNLLATQVYIFMVSIFNLALSIWILVKLSQPSFKEK